MGLYAVTTGGEQGLTTSTETVLQIRGNSSTRARVIAWSISFDGTDSSAAPVLVELLRQTTDGTGSAATEFPLDTADPTSALVTAFTAFSAEPTAGDILESYEIHPQGGLIVREYPPGREIYISASSSNRLGIRCSLPAGTVNCVAWLHWEE